MNVWICFTYLSMYMGIPGVQSFCLYINSGDVKWLLVQKSVITWQSLIVYEINLWVTGPIHDQWNKCSEVWPAQRNLGTFIGMEANTYFTLTLLCAVLILTRKLAKPSHWKGREEMFWVSCASLRLLARKYCFLTWDNWWAHRIQNA